MPHTSSLADEVAATRTRNPGCTIWHLAETASPASHRVADWVAADPDEILPVAFELLCIRRASGLARTDLDPFHVFVENVARLPRHARATLEELTRHGRDNNIIVHAS